MRPYALREEVGVEGGVARQRQNLAVLRVHHDDDAALIGRVLQLLLGCELQIEVNGRDQILSGLRRGDGEFALYSTATVNLDLAVSVFATQVSVVGRFESLLPDDVAGVVRVVGVVFELRLLELFGAYLADVAKDVSEHAAVWVATLRLLAHEQHRELQSVRVNPGEVCRSCALLDRHLLEGGLVSGLLEVLAQNVGRNVQPFGEWLDEFAQVFALHVFAGEDHVVGRARVDEEFAAAVEDRAARRWDAQTPDSLVLRALGVVVAVNDL